MTLDLHTDLTHAGLERGEVDLAVALQRVGIAREDFRARPPDGDVEDRPLLKLAQVHVAGVLAGRDGAHDARTDAAHDLAVFGSRHAERALEWSQGAACSMGRTSRPSAAPRCR